MPRTEGLKALHTRAKPLFTAAALSLWLAATACFPEGPTASDAGEESSFEDLAKQVSQLAKQEDLQESRTVKATLQTGRTAAGSMALVSDINAVDYRLVGCSSGYSVILNNFADQSLGLYRFDQNCQIHIQKLQIAELNYTLAPNVNFDGTQAAVNTFTSPDGQKIFVKVMSQLPAILNASEYGVSFVVSEAQEGLAVSHSIYEVGISVDTPQLRENSSSSVGFTIKRAAPALGALQVNIAYEGDATPGIDTTTLPMSVTLAAGQTTRGFTITMINDTHFEAPELLRVRVTPGTNYIPKEPPADLIIIDDDVATLVAEAASFNFGNRALNLPHSYQLKITNTGRTGASQIQALGTLSAPFLFPGGFPGDDASCSNNLPAGQSCTINVGFNPSVSGLRTATFNISYFNGVEPSQLSVGVQGSGANAAHLLLSETGLYDFGAIKPLQSSKKHIILKNFGQATATGIGATFSSTLFNWVGGTFPGTGGSCTTSLTAGSSCTVVINFSGPSAGFYAGLMQVNYSNASQQIRLPLNLEGSISSLLAEGATYGTGLNTSLSFSLKASGDSGGLSYEVLHPTRFGSLSGTPPNLIYTPQAGFSGLDTLSFRAIDANGPSETAEVRILVSPRALLLAESFNLNPLESQLFERMQDLGFVVTVQDDNVSAATDANGKNILLLSKAARSNRLQNKFRDSTVAAMAWDRDDYSELRMTPSAGSSTGEILSRQIRILNSTHPLTSGYPVGNLQIFNSNAPIAYASAVHPNMQAMASTTTSTTQALIFGYEERNYLPGGLIAPARRLGTFLPLNQNVLNPSGWDLFDKGVNWLLQSRNEIFFDSFQRDPSLSLGKAWQENENGGTSVFQVAGDQLQFNSFTEFSSAKSQFPMQNTGYITLSFYLDLIKTASAPGNYLLELQLGRCDLMDKALPATSGAAVHLLWGGTGSGLSAESSLGYKIGSATSSLAVVNQRRARISVEVDLSNKRYAVRMPNGSLSSLINFDAQVNIDCLRLSSRNINSNGFTYRGIEQLKIIPGR